MREGGRANVTHLAMGRCEGNLRLRRGRGRKRGLLPYGKQRAERALEFCAFWKTV